MAGEREMVTRFVVYGEVRGFFEDVERMTVKKVFGLEFDHYPTHTDLRNTWKHLSEQYVRISYLTVEKQYRFN